MSGQWFHQPPPQTSYGYHTYHAQHQPPQYSEEFHAYPNGPQVHPYHQYNQGQQAPYQQSHRHPPAQPYKPQVAKPSLQTCYNCGSPEHWAQDCPERRREVPAGDLARLSFIRPNKKFRPNYIPPVITKYPVPPSAQDTHVSPQIYGSHPYAQFGATHVPVPYGQPSPIPVQSAGQPSQLHRQDNYRPSYGQYQRRNTYPQQPHHSQGSPTGFLPGSHYTSSVFAQGVQQHPGFNQSYGSVEHYQDPQYPVYPSVSPTVVETPFTADRRKSSFSNGYNREASYTQSRSVQSQSVTPGPTSSKPPIDKDDEDDLALLDVPDMPVSLDSQSKSSIQLITYPLPAYAEDEDIVTEPITLLSSENGGFVRSRYFASGKFPFKYDEPKQHFADDARRTDPIFCFTTNDETTLPISALLHSHGRKTINELHCEGVRGGYMSKFSRKSSDTHEAEDFVSRSSQYPDKLTSSESLAPCHIATAQETEDRLAALGVSGLSKPVKVPACQYPSPNLQSPPESRSPPDSGKNGQYQRRYSDHGSSPYDTNPRKRDFTTYRQNHHSRSPPMKGNLASEHRQASSPPSFGERTPVYEQKRDKAWAATEHDPFDPEDEDPDDLDLSNSEPFIHMHYDQHNPPPPPHSTPPPRQNHLTYNLSQEHQGLPGLPQRRQTSHPTNGSEQKDKSHQAGSPIRINHERSYERKRERKDDSDDEPQSERRRQHDDVTPKLKRRQPKVAEAYSRRW